MQPITSINLDNLKLWDKILKKFNIKNSGTLDIKDIQLKVDYTVNETTLIELKLPYSEVVSQKIFLSKWSNTGGLKAGKMDCFWMKFSFEDNGKDQNVFQGDSIKLKMEFQAN